MSSEGQRLEKDTGAKTLVVQLDTDQLQALVREVIQQELLALRIPPETRATGPAHEDELEPLLTASQLAEVLNCGVRTLKRWLQEGVAPPPAETPGSRLRWYKPAVRRWLEQHCPGVAESPFALGSGAPAAEQPQSRWRKVED